MEQVATFETGGTAWQLGSMAVGNLDNSPDLEIIVPYRDSTGSWFLDAFKFTGERLPGFPYAGGGSPLNASPALADLDGDGHNEIVFTCGNRVVACRGDGSVKWSRTVDSNSYVPTGGYQTVTNGFYWWPAGVWLDRLPSTAVFSSEVSPPIIAALNGGQSNEVITAWKIQPDPIAGNQDFNPFIQQTFGVGPWGAMGEAWSGGVVTFDAATGRQNFVYHLHHLVESGLGIGRPNSTGARNIYALNDSDSVVAFDKSRPFGLWGKGMLHKQFGKNLRFMSGSYQVPIDVFTADIDGDGRDEALVAGTQLSSLWQPNETILDDDGTILWRRWLPHLDLTNNSGWLNSASLIPVNPDHDNQVDVLGWNHGYELTFRYWNGVALVDRPGWPKDFRPLLPTPPVVGDVDGDGSEEIVVGTYDPTGASPSGELRIYALDGTLKQSVAVPGGIKQIPVLADVEGVGRTDVICRTSLGRVFIWNFGAAGTNLISWAAARGNMRRDGNCHVSLYPPGTPRIVVRQSGYRRTSFSWTNSETPSSYRVYRSTQAGGPYHHLATVTSSTSSFTDDNLQPGWQYFYEIAAVYHDRTVLSAPFAILSLLNGNLVANAGFERDDNCKWDKWSGDNYGLTNMCVTTNVAYQGKCSMQILLQNQSGLSSSVAQNNQYGIPDSSIDVVPGAYYSFSGYFKSTGMATPSEHWLEWSSTKTGADTNDRPVLPDPYYYTPHFLAGPEPVDWTYVNRTFRLPPGFPNVELRHRFQSAGNVSGAVYLDNISFRRIPDPAATNWTVLVPFGAAWRFNSNPQPPDWIEPGFNDGAWPVAAAKFGAGSGPTNITTRLPQFLSRYFFRKSFYLESTNIEELLLSATCTDADVLRLYPLQLFLNGKRVPAMIDTVTLQGNEVRYFDLVPFVSLLHAGNNTIAVELDNAWTDYDDVAFDVSLAASFHEPNVAKLTVARPAGAVPSLITETPPGSVWQIQSCNAMAPNNWQVLQVFTNTDGGRILFQDRSQTGSTGNASARFYRLVPF